MRAIGNYRPGPIDQAGSLADVDLPDPVADAGMLLVRVRAFSVNPADVKARANVPLREGSEVRVLGFDGAGEVIAVGDGVRDFRSGDRVYFVADGFDRGSNAEMTLVDARMAARIPDALGWAQAAALPVAAGTAWEILFERMDVTRPVPGAAAAVLVVNGAGGVGSAAIQLLRARTDLLVIASASRPETQDWVRALGAHHVIDHRKPMAPQVSSLGIGQPGLILSTSHTDDHLADLIDLIAPQGRIGAIDDPSRLDIVPLKDKSLSFHWEYLLTRSSYDTSDVSELGRALGEVAALIDAGRFRSIVTQERKGIRAATLIEAHRAVESGSVFGKVVLSDW